MPDPVIAIVFLTSICTIAGAVLFLLANRVSEDSTALSEEINALLPQTQCGQCNYPGCRPYAEAIAAGDADINHCPPGGDACIESLAKLLGREVIALAAEHAQTATVQAITPVAFIREDECIGCTLCIHACPVDAILGSARMMHTVITSECTGCELCIPPCPVDCIDLLAPATLLTRSTSATQPMTAPL